MNTKKSTPFFSIVIPTLNEERYLPRLLKDLTKQTFYLEQMEIIHVDGKSKDKTVVLAEEYKSKLDIKSYSVEQHNVAFQRNYGAKKARGEWVIFMDADDRLPKYFLDGIKYQLAKKIETDVFTCLFQPEKRLNSDINIIKALNLVILIQEKLGSPLVFGAMIGIKRNILGDYNFDENLCLGEDAEFIRRLLKKYQFNIFEEPKFALSLRRVRKEGVLKTIVVQANILIRTWFSYISKENNYGYVMEGGNYYNQKNPLMTKLIKRKIKSLTKTQLKKIKHTSDLFLAKLGLIA